MSPAREVQVGAAACAVLMVIAVLLLFGEWFGIKHHAPDLVETIKAEEGCREAVYLDTRGHRTIGCGTNIDLPLSAAEAKCVMGDPAIDLAKHIQPETFAFVSGRVTMDQADCLLTAALHEKRDRLRKEWPPFDSQPRYVQDALTDLAYQIGVRGVLGFHDMLAALSRGDLAGAVLAGKDSAWFRETPKRAMRVLGALRGD